MKRAGRLLFAAVPLLAVTAYLLVPAGKAEKADGPSSDARASAPAGSGEGDLASPEMKDLAQRIVSSAENSSLDWRAQYDYIEDIDDGRGYTAGIIGFTTGTHDLLVLVERYTESRPDNALARFLPALREVDGSDSHKGLGAAFTAAWKAEARTDAFRRAQDSERDRVYFDPAVRAAKRDGLGALGQFIYYDAMVMHGPGSDPGFHGIRARAVAEADTPAEGGDEKAYLDIFLDVRRGTMKSEKRDTTRIDTAQRRFLYDGNLALETPLRWKVYGTPYELD
ncbi:chitosanase [Streptomyces fructofermentans]|uniref:Chitosanase n=1 Tax=Streptomyces fructofermentans TaxID=152141 RepID=A0A918NE20_9ACTN|nr:chitosanase [Streptomyces fructofermentans]GGX61150.1 chitosanase [Streptomyces fructofermentans]